MLKVPTRATLKRYGLSLEEWERIANSQGRVCAICGGLPKSGSGILHIDHFHLKGWKKLKPNERKKEVRGLCCYRCNSQFLRRGLTAELSMKVSDYLNKFEKKKKDGEEK